jgi:hypothetical protein
VTPTLARALSVARLGLAVLDIEAKERAPGRETANPFGLPAGTPIRRTLTRFFRRQLARIFDRLPRDPLAEVPAAFDVTDWTDEMTSAMTPVIRPYWDRGGKRLYAEVGLDPKSWEVVSPALAPKIREQSFFFCQSTNESTTLRLQAAHAELRRALDEGLVQGGESLPWLTKRVSGIYTGLTRQHAGMIAATEASRAQHAAQFEAARESEVVKGFRWMLSGDACPACHRIARETPEITLDGEFATIGDHPYYSTVRHPPAHPRCMCSLEAVVDYESLGIEPEAGKSLPFLDDLDARIVDLEAKYRACRDRRGRFASCGGGSARSQDIRHIPGRGGKPTKPGRYDKETAAATRGPGGGQQMVDPVAAEAAVAEVRAGTAKLLGRGSEGATYQVGDLIVKHSKRDGSDLAEAARVANEMRAAGVPGIPPYHIVGSGKDAATVRPAYDIPERLTLPQLEQNRATLRAMHDRGYTLSDEFVDNVGVDRAGNAWLIDTGYARKVQDGPLPEGRRHHDLENLRAFYAFQLDPARRPYRTNRPPDHPAYRDLDAEVARASAAGKS